MRVLASTLKIGDTILPPPHEVRSWMKRHLQAKGLPESALYLTITGIEEARPDKRGPWLLVTSTHTNEWWEAQVERWPFKFKIRPETLWQKIELPVIGQ